MGDGMTRSRAEDRQSALPGYRPTAADAGWPRPLAPWRQSWGTEDRCPELPDSLPVPWINGPCVRDHGDWHSFRDRGLEMMVAGRLCLICGEPVEGAIYLPAQGYPEDRVTSGGGGHARCVLLAVKRCPHMAARSYVDDDVVGWRYDGDGLGFLVVKDCYGEDSHGDCDPVDETAVPITLGELKVAAHG